MRDPGVTVPLSPATDYFSFDPSTYESPYPQNKTSPRRNLSRRVSRSLRRISWSSKSLRSVKYGKDWDDDESDNGSWSSETTEKLKRVSKRRDWSDELEEDDFSFQSEGLPTPLLIRRETRIIWAEEPCDIGRHWTIIKEE